MRFCKCENQDFPESQFRDEGGRLMHHPPGGRSHPVEETAAPPPAPLRLMTADELLGRSSAGKRRRGRTDR